MYWSTLVLGLFSTLAFHDIGSHAFVARNQSDACPTTSEYPIGIVQTYSAYACRGDLQSFNVTAGKCMDAQTFQTARGYRKGAPPSGQDCAFNYYAAAGCKGPSVSTGKDADGSNNWSECIRNFLASNGDAAAAASSFMFVCYPRH